LTLVGIAPLRLREAADDEESPVAGLPRVLWAIGRALPATHMIDVMRGAVLRSAGPLDMLPSLLALAAISVVLVAISIRGVRRLTV